MAAVAASSTAVAHPTAGTSPKPWQELYASLKTKQKDQICFDWNHKDPKRGLLRTFVANNWNITKAEINSDFYSDSQRAIIEKIFEGIIAPEWHERYYQQLEDDAGGFGNEQFVAIFGKPGDGKFELVLTGRHMTLRCDGNSADHVAFGGPISTAMPTFNEDPEHTDNVFWSQAVEANKLYQMLDGSQRKASLVKKTPREQAVSFKGKQGGLTGLPVSEMSGDRAAFAKVLGLLTEMYRTSDGEEAMQCLKGQGGLDQCTLVLPRSRPWQRWRLG